MNQGSAAEVCRRRGSCRSSRWGRTVPRHVRRQGRGGEVCVSVCVSLLCVSACLSANGDSPAPVSACLCGQDSSRVLRPCCELLAVRAHRPPRAPPPRSARPRYFCFESLTTTNARTDTVLGYEMLSCAGAAGDCVRPGAGPVRVSVFFMCQRRRERTHMRSALIRTDPHCLCAVGAVTPYCKSCKSAQARCAHALHTLCTRSAHSWDTLGKVDARQIHKANPQCKSMGSGGSGRHTLHTVGIHWATAACTVTRYGWR
jgi:hypothetical protein